MWELDILCAYYSKNVVCRLMICEGLFYIFEKLLKSVSEYLIERLHCEMSNLINSFKPETVIICDS